MSGGSQAPAKATNKPRRWFRWAVGLIATASLALGALAIRPSWASAAAGWPLIGPLVTERILKDAGLKWAYDIGLMQQSLAEAKDGDTTVRIRGVIANSRQTTVLYQVSGLPASPGIQPHAYVGEPGEENWIHWAGPSVKTADGFVATSSAIPKNTDAKRNVITVEFGDRTAVLAVHASPVDSDKFYREVAVNRSQEIDGVNIVMESVTYTPAETVIRYRDEAPSFSGPVGRDDFGDPRYIESAGKRYQETGGGGYRLKIAAYAPVEGPITFVVPRRIKGVPVDLSWPLRAGARQQVRNISIALTGARQTDNGFEVTWESGVDKQFVGISDFELVDATGQAYKNLEGSESGGLQPSITSRLPAGVTPVVVRAKQIGLRVIGPWRFELPQ
jgi:hypothetical protein